MMPVVRINDATFANLSTLKTWYQTKTPSDTIDLIVSEALEKLGIEHDDKPSEIDDSVGDLMKFNTAPGLAFTKLLTASVNGKKIANPKWSTVLLAVISHLKSLGLNGDGLARELYIPAKSIKYEDEGYKYQASLGISIQGQSASDAWKEIDRLAKKWSIPTVIEFAWRENSKAQHPGRIGILQSGNS